jgi:amino acid transporter
MKSKIIMAIVAITAMVLMPELLAADNLDTTMGKWEATLTAAGGLFKVAVGFAGAIFAFLGIIGLKKYADDARQNPLMKPLIMFCAGALALGFTAFTGQLGTTGTGTADTVEVFK